MASTPERKTIAKAIGVGLVFFIASGGVFSVLAPYQASRVYASLADLVYARTEAPLLLATAAEDGAYYRLGDQLRLYMEASQSYHLEVLPTSGSVENLIMLKEGRADLALIQGGLTAARSDASGDFGGLVSDPDTVVALANLGRQYVHLVVPADSQIRAFRDLAGKRLGVGPSGSGSEFLAKKVMGFFRFGEETALISDHNPDLARAFLNGEIDAAFAVYGLFAPAMEELLARGWYRLVPIVESEALARFLPGTFDEVLPSYLYGPDRGIPTAEEGPFHTLAVNTLLVSQSDLPDRQVYALLQEIFSGHFLKLARLTDLNENRAQAALHLPLHTAAEAFYNRRDPISSDRFEILSFFLAGIVCIASAVHFLLGRHRVSLQLHRRDAIRPYFEALMDFGDSVEAANAPSTLSCLIHKMMATQRGAERKWLEGEFDTEDMENLYAVYSLRCDNAFNKIFDLHLQSMRGIDIVEGVRNSNVAALSPPPDTSPSAESSRHPCAVSGVRPWEFQSAEESHPSAQVSSFQRNSAADDFFTGAPLAGIDQTKKEIAASLPPQYDSGLLYDTEASGAGAVRIRTSKPTAELQATVEKDVPDGETLFETPADIAEEEDPRPDQMLLF